MQDAINPEYELKKAEQELFELDQRRAHLNEQIKRLKDKCRQYKDFRTQRTIHSRFAEHEKISIFRSLFKGREDIFARRFESKTSGKSGYMPVCRNEWKYGLCGKPKIKCADCQNRNFTPINDAIIRSHLLGKDESGRDFTIGIYPILSDDTCYFIAVDFDKNSWEIDTKAFLQTAKKINVPVCVEKSRSGNGAHAWIFFTETISAKIARQMCSYLVTATMDERPELGFDSYDRFFPNQDTMPKGGFGNLIALPLQFLPRQKGNSVFVNENLQPYEDQWGYLSSVPKMTPDEVYKLANMAHSTGRITGVKIVLDEEDICPWKRKPSGRKEDIINFANLPESIDIILSNQIYLNKEQLTTQLKTKFMRIAAFQNPEFYKAQAMRLPVYNKPRIISCREELPLYLGIPRGCQDDVSELCKQLNIRTNLIDKRNEGIKQEFRFYGSLHEEQKKAVQSLIKYDFGILSASTAFGKTVVAAYMIAARKVNTLILVHRIQLVEQWRARLQTFLNIDSEIIGTIGEGKKRPKSIIDIATLQSLCKKGVVDDIVENYGFVIVDECHHLSAVSFELVTRQCKAKYLLGLSATLTRKDGHHPIIFMQCGPVRYKVNDIQQAALRPFNHRVIIRRSDLQPYQTPSSNDVYGINDIYSLISKDNERNSLIVKDVINALNMGRNPLVITERKDHLELLYSQLSGVVKHLIVLKGGMRKKDRLSEMQRVSDLPHDEPRIILATGKFLGEGFDDAKLDTLFLTMPISWRGTLSQYAGRLHRIYHNKKEVQIYDYVDGSIPMTIRMFNRRVKGYKAIGYHIDDKDMYQGPLNL